MEVSTPCEEGSGQERMKWNKMRKGREMVGDNRMRRRGGRIGGMGGFGGVGRELCRKG